MAGLGIAALLDADVPPDASQQVVAAISTTEPRAFRAIGHCLLALIAGLVGALVARWFHDSREQESLHAG